MFMPRMTRQEHTKLEGTIFSGRPNVHAENDTERREMKQIIDDSPALMESEENS